MAGIYKLVLVLIIYVVLTAGSFGQRPLAYVSNRVSDDISIIDTSTNLVTDTINVGSKPRGIAINPSCSRVYVALEDANEVAVINTKTKSVVANIPVGDEPFSVAIHPSGSPVYVTNWEDDVVTVIDANTNRVVAPDIRVGDQQQNVSFDPSGTYAFVAHRGANDRVSVINRSKNAVDVTSITVGNGDSKPRDIAFHPKGNPAYITLRKNNSVSVIDTLNNTETTTIPVGDEPVNITVSPDGSRAYVTNNGDDNVSVINLIDYNKIISTITVGQTPNGLAMTPDSKHVFVANKDDTVSVIKTESDQVIETISVGGQPWDVAICQIIPKTIQKDVKNRMQIYGRVYRQNGEEKVLLKDSASLELDCDRIIQKGESNSRGQYNLINSTGIRECKLKVKINDVTTSWPPLDVIFSSKPRRYDLIY
ncbi:MAG: beta-propeller fold lactonase family protein [Deltaproteobacteria bacterium]|nr:beta-propeller fold lactonase family protein [Deltaproteobacteria bacterium]